MRIRVLGPLLVGDPPTALSRRDRVVAAALAARRGDPCAPDDIAEALWGGARPATWTKVVQGAVVRLRQALGHQAIDWGPDGYRLLVADDDLDVAVFEELLRRGRRLDEVGEPARALAAYDDALALWRGRPFPDLDDWPAGQDEVRRLEALRAGLDEERLSVAVSTGRAQESVGVAQQLVRESPYRERRWELLALALYASGRQAESLDAIASAKRTLREDLGLDAGAGITDLERAILGHDPSLPQGRAPRSSDICPYQGLTAFQPEHQDLFVGRETDVVACLRRLDEHPLLLVVGSSGSGKSSLARAGLVPALRRGGRSVVVVVPATEPVAELTREREGAASGTALVVDQLEELAGSPDAERTAFLDLVATWAQTGPVVLTIRSDRLDLLTASSRLAKQANRGLYLLPPLGEPELRRVVLEPADRVGLLVEPGLVDVLLRDVGDRPGALPLLSHALRQTWLNREGDVLTVDGYAATGGIAGAVAQTADAVYDELDADHRRALRSLLLRLVSITPDGAPVGTRLATGHRTEPDLLTVIERLAANRLVTVEDGAVSLSHESLAQAWPRLRSWLDDDVRGRLVLEHLKVAAAGWAATGRPVAELYSGVRLAAAEEWRAASRPVLSADEEDFLDASLAHDEDDRRAEQQALRETRRRNRRLRVLLGTVAALLVLALTAAGLVVSSRRDTVRAARELAAARLGDLAAREPRADTALLAARQAVELASTPQTSADLLRAVDARADIRSLRETGLTGFIGAQPQVSPDGSRLLALQLDGIHLVEPATGRMLPSGAPAVPGEIDAGLYAVGFVDDGRTALVTAGAGADEPDRTCELRRLDAASGVVTGPAEPIPGSRCGDFFARDRFRATRDGSLLVSMSGDTVRWWARSDAGWRGPREVAVPGLSPGTPIARWLTVSDDGRVAAATVDLGNSAPWYSSYQVPVAVDLDAGRVLGPVRRDLRVSKAAVSPDGARVLVGGTDGWVGVRGAGDASVTTLASGGQPAVTALAWSGDGRTAYVGRHDGRVDAIDVATASVRSTLAGHGLGVAMLREVAAEDGPGLVSLDESGVVITRTLGPSTALGARRKVTRPHSVAVLAGGGPVLAGEEGGVVAVYDRLGLARDGELRLEAGRVPAPPDVDAARRRVSALATTSDGSAVVAGDRTGRLTVWSWPERAVRWTHDDAPTAFLAVTPDGKVLVTAELALPEGDPTPDGFPEKSWIRLWDMATGAQLAQIETEDRKPRLVAVSPDSRTAVVGFFSEGTEVVDLVTRRVVHTLGGDASTVTFTPDGSRLVVVDFAGHGTVFGTDDWTPEGRFSTLTAGYAHLLVEPTGRLMFLANANDVSVWDPSALRRLVARVSLPGDGTNDGIFLAAPADEPVMAVASQGEITLTDLRESIWRDTACRLADRQLTRDEWERLLPGREYEPACG